MHFCPTCQRVMTRDTSTGAVVFQCVCGVATPGRAEDARIGGAVLGAGETTEMYRRLIQTAPFDRTNQLVRRLCTRCGRDYMTQIRVGEAEVIVYKCKCGAEESGGGRESEPVS
jgi:DNA-directed RNA polymerase subunit M/transcription elongation factor TFIIS